MRKSDTVEHVTRGTAVSLGPAARQQVVVITISGPDGATRRQFEAFPVRIGREGDNEIQLTDPTASRHHARVELVDGSLAVTDLGSRIGTLLCAQDGRRVVPHISTLLHGGAFTIGNTEFGATLRESPTVLDTSMPGAVNGDVPPSPRPARGETETYDTAKVNPRVLDSEEAAVDVVAAKLRDAASALRAMTLLQAHAPAARINVELQRLLTAVTETGVATSRPAAQPPESVARIGPPRRRGETEPMPERAISIAALEANVLRANEALATAIEWGLREAPTAERRLMAVREIITSHPRATEVPEVRRILRLYGWAASESDGDQALGMLNAYASRIVGRDRPLQTPHDVRAFVTAISTAIEELATGALGAFANLSQYDSPVELESIEGRLPRNKEEMTEALLDWRNDPSHVVRWTRALFKATRRRERRFIRSVATGVQAIIQELSPTEIEAAIGESWWLRWFGDAVAWRQALRVRHARWKSGERVSVVFGKTFAAHYASVAGSGDPALDGADDTTDEAPSSPRLLNPAP